MCGQPRETLSPKYSHCLCSKSSWCLGKFPSDLTKMRGETWQRGVPTEASGDGPGVEQVLLEHRGLGVTPGTGPRRGLSLGGSADTATSELLRVSDKVLCVTSSQNGCWNHPQELGATDAPSSLTCQTAGSPKVAGGNLTLQHGAASFPTLLPNPS